MFYFYISFLPVAEQFNKNILLMIFHDIYTNNHKIGNTIFAEGAFLKNRYKTSHVFYENRGWNNICCFEMFFRYSLKSLFQTCLFWHRLKRTCLIMLKTCLKHAQTTAAVFPRGSQKRKSNNDAKHDHGQETRRPSALCRGIFSAKYDQTQ